MRSGGLFVVQVELGFYGDELVNKFIFLYNWKHDQGAVMVQAKLDGSII